MNTSAALPPACAGRRTPEMNNAITQTRIDQPQSKYFEAIRLAARLLQAKLIRDQRNKKLCVCLSYIGDHGPCPVHGEGGN